MSIRVQTQDNTEVIVDSKVVEMSMTLKNVVEDCKDIDPNTLIPLPNVTGETMVEIGKFCVLYREKMPEVKDFENYQNTIDTPVPDWAVDIFKTYSMDTLSNVIVGSNYLDIKPLLDYSAHFVADMIKGKTPEEIRKTFNLPDDLTDEEKEKIRIENDWCEYTL